MTRYPSWSGIRSRPAVRAAVVWKTTEPEYRERLTSFQIQYTDKNTVLNAHHNVCSCCCLLCQAAASLPPAASAWPSRDWLTQRLTWSKLLIRTEPNRLSRGVSRTETAGYMAGRGKLIAVIGDEDTVTGFLLGGIGELNKNRKPNFLVVEKDTSIAEIEETFKWGPMLVYAHGYTAETLPPTVKQD